MTLQAFNLRLMYFLRIFPSTAPIVRIVIDVTYDIRYYLMVLFICIFGIMSSLYSISCSSPKGNEIATGLFSYFIYSYKLALGDFSTDKFEYHPNKYLIWFIFIFGTLFLLIILLNLLISIMGEALSLVLANIEAY
jgi:hypothetical protein